MNIFQTGEWMATLSDGYGYIPSCLMYEEAGLPYMVERKFGFTNYFSMPLSTYGGVDNGGDYESYHLTKTFAELPGVGYKYIVTYDDQAVWNGFQVSKQSTQVKGVTPSINDMWNTLHKNTQSSIKSAWTYNISVHIDDEMVGRELLVKQFPEKFLDALDYHMGRYYFPYVTMKDDRIIGTAITFVYEDTMTYWCSMNTQVGRMCNANYILIWTAIQDAHKAGCKEFNFGNNNMVKYETTWGTNTHEYNVHYIVPRLLKPFMKVRQWIY